MKIPLTLKAVKEVPLPPDHKPAVEVPPGGSTCLKCTMYDSKGGGKFGTCKSSDYQEYYGTAEIPMDPNRFCSDWFQARPELLKNNETVELPSPRYSE